MVRRIWWTRREECRVDGWVGKWQILNPTGRCENEKLEKDKWWGAGN